MVKQGERKAAPAGASVRKGVRRVLGLMRAEDEGGPEGPKFALKIGKRGYVRGRSKRILVKLTEDEHSSIAAAGELVQLSATGFTAEAALAAAQAKLDALDVFERTGVWPAEGSPGVLVPTPPKT